MKRRADAKEILPRVGAALVLAMITATGSLATAGEGGLAAVLPEFHKIELSWGTGYHAPLATVGLQIAVRPVRWASFEVAVGGAPASTNPDIGGCLLTVFFGRHPCDKVRYVGRAPWRLGAGLNLIGPVMRKLELSLGFSIVRNPGAVRTVYESIDNENIDDYTSYTELTPTAWLAQAAAALTYRFKSRWFLRGRLGFSGAIAFEEKSPSADQISHSRVPEGGLFQLELGVGI